jgi:hypothetical protein
MRSRASWLLSDQVRCRSRVPRGHAGTTCMHIRGKAAPERALSTLSARGPDSERIRASRISGRTNSRHRRHDAPAPGVSLHSAAARHGVGTAGCARSAMRASCSETPRPTGRSPVGTAGAGADGPRLRRGEVAVTRAGAIRPVKGSSPVSSADESGRLPIGRSAVRIGHGAPTTGASASVGANADEGE